MKKKWGSSSKNLFMTFYIWILSEKPLVLDNHTSAMI